MNRLFTFGCSFTAYAWPTWANIIAFDKKIPFYNYADAGMGNIGIAHRVLEADLKHKFTSNDEIYILWSSYGREDRIKEDFWNSTGSIFNPNNKDYFGYFIRKYWSLNNDIVKNSHAMITTDRIFKNNIKWQGTAFPFYSIEEWDLKLTDINKQLISLYEKQMPDIPYIKLELPLEEYLAFNGIRDMHPDVIKHLELAEQVYNQSNQTLKQETKDYFYNVQSFFENIVSKNSISDLDELVKYMPEFFMNFKEMIPLMNQVPLVKHLPEIERS